MTSSLPNGLGPRRGAGRKHDDRVAGLTGLDLAPGRESIICGVLQSYLRMKNPCCLAVWFCLVVVGAAAEDAAAPAGKGVAPDLLFVQPVHQGSIADGVLTIENHQAPILFFMERPGRVTGVVTAQRFLALWNEGTDSFQKDPPNAVLTTADGEKLTSVVLELTSVAATPSGMRYGVKVLSGTPPAQFGSASLVIDSYPGNRAQAAPAVALGNLYQASAQALSNAAHNATNNQQQSYVTAQAATTMGVATLYSLDAASTGPATAKVPPKR